MMNYNIIKRRLLCCQPPENDSSVVNTLKLRRYKHRPTRT